ncbi:MAG: PEGA domain-containing protein [Verrucomicrobiota bacterium]
MKSVPPGADVGTLRSKFGETPVSARFKPGHSYSLVFSKDGYRSVTKVVRVSEAPDQEFEVILRRAPAAKPSPQAPATPAPPPAAVPKPNERTWFQRMFAR